ncbi:hypothetical protein TM1040_1317 [Ruegeria sp. TM1040]|nr:hypothetical protein TM1040_1317 [Ruegeria sp. TM1040]
MKCRHREFHSAASYLVSGMKALGGAANPPRNEHAPEYFPAGHHGTAEHQDHAGIRTRRGLREQWSLKSLITGARAGARGGQSRHRQLFLGGATHG